MILECKNETFKKDNLKILIDIIKTVVKNTKSNEAVKTRMKTVVFDKLLKIIDFSITNKNNLNENSENTLSSLNSEIISCMNDDHQLKVFI